ncbi:hypothetical protein [Cellulomonas shaoxiangyii]|uniref:Uncharacterized protein n=1 Tax=Cellulomonas shaoxiangyii TaxID=2566013 RepID=A0A4P7SK68_9CELL|nr:hypothetical protein [Cellulomonas shaoxiangyii]QCB93114.1 hypothetical protein E5225_05655 [Cellulomonas shaoxiangyii]TGY84856.1 hypothetical protein E5226_09160 [Cellulomonas shaoxiangyii]
MPTPRPALLVAACGLVVLEALALAAAAVAGVVTLVRGAQAPAVAAFLVALALGAALLLASAARGLWSGRRWGRGPVLTAQVLLVVVSATAWSSGARVPGAVGLVLGLVVAATVLAPPVVAVTSRTGRDEPDRPA